MPYIPLRNIGKGGLVPDQAPYDVELTQFPNGDNVSFQNGVIGKTLGHVDEGITIPNKPVSIAGYFKSGINNIFIGTKNNIYRFNGTSITDVTGSSGTYSNSTRWQTDQMGSGIFFNNGSDVPKYINQATLSSNGTFSDIANWPSNVSTECLKPYKSFLVMAGYAESSNTYSTRVRWSDEFDPSGVPQSYDVTSTTNLAGFNELGGENGELVDQLTLGNTQMLYAERGVYAMDFIGAPLVFSFREIFSDQGIINRGACAVFEGKHLVVGSSDIYVHDGNSKKSLANLKVKDYFYKTLEDATSVYCEAVPERSEVWINYADKYSYVDASDGKHSPNKCLIYNWDNDAFTFTDIPNARDMAHADVMSLGATEGNWGSGDLLTWDTSTDWWSNSSLLEEAKEKALFAVDHTNSKLLRMGTSRSFSGLPISCFIESTKIDLDSVMGTSNNTIKQINGVMPQMEGSGAVTVSIGISDTPSSPVNWIEVRDFNIETDYKIDVRASARYLAFRVDSSNSADFWNLTGLDVDIREVASR